MRPIPLIIFAKTPVAGAVKTRLLPHCNADQAAEIAKLLLTCSVENAVNHWPGEVLLAVWPDIDDPFTQRLAETYALRRMRQSEGDLGQKMYQALTFVGFPAAVVGADIPHISPAIFKTTYARLSAGQHLIGPSRDGGYYLMGLSTDCPDIFQEIDWGTNRVLQQTFKRLPLNLTLQRLDELFDVDEWPEVIEVAQYLPLLQQYLNREGLQ